MSREILNMYQRKVIKIDNSNVKINELTREFYF